MEFKMYGFSYESGEEKQLSLAALTPAMPLTHIPIYI